MRAFTVTADNSVIRVPEFIDEEVMLAADPAATGEVVTISGERYVVRADNLVVLAAMYFD
jgi:threonine dehydrogenase-like Zn-dependent dehydrogenase